MCKMAASGGGKIKKSKSKILDIDLDGVFQTQTRSQIVHDVIKFIISQRQIIPVTYQQLQRDLDPKLKVPYSLTIVKMFELTI